MANKTLLKMTQLILSALDYDEVSSIGATAEATQVVDVIEETYDHIADALDLPCEHKLFQPTSVADEVHVTMPTNMSLIESVEYDKKTSLTDPTNYGIITYLEPKDFLAYVQPRNDTESNIETLTINGTTIPVRNDAHPTYYTSFDNATFVFDSYYTTLDSSGLVASKFRCYGEQRPSITREDSFAFPLLAEHVANHLYQEAKSAALEQLKGRIQRNLEERRRITKRSVMKKKDRVAGRPLWKGYGRRPRLKRRS